MNRSALGSWCLAPAWVSLALIAVVACSADPIEVRKTENKGIDLERLFDVDGCHVYRFLDSGNYRYVVTCPRGGSVSWNMKRGRTTEPFSIETGEEP